MRTERETRDFLKSDRFYEVCDKVDREMKTYHGSLAYNLTTVVTAEIAELYALYVRQEAQRAEEDKDDADIIVLHKFVKVVNEL